MQTEITFESESFRALLGAVFVGNCAKWLRFIFAVLRNEADAEDVLQEAIRRVLDRNVLLHSEDQVRMYLGRAIANAAMEHYNSLKRDRLRQLSLTDQVMFAQRRFNPRRHMENWEKSYEKERLLGLLDQGLKQLPRKQYEAVRLTILESGELSLRDVGVRNGIAYSTLRHRSMQGVRQLRKYLKAKARSQESGVRMNYE